MSGDERDRHELYGRLEEVLGAEYATVLMEHLPAPFANLATKDDLRSEAALVRSDLRGEISLLQADLRGEIALVRADLKSETGLVRGEMGQLRHELTALFRKELSDSISAQTRTIVLALFAAMATSSSLAFAAARLV